MAYRRGRKHHGNIALVIHPSTLYVIICISCSTKPASRGHWVEPDQLKDLSEVGARQGVAERIRGDGIQGEVFQRNERSVETNVASAAVISTNGFLIAEEKRTSATSVLQYGLALSGPFKIKRSVPDDKTKGVRLQREFSFFLPMQRWITFDPLCILCVDENTVSDYSFHNIYFFSRDMQPWSFKDKPSVELWYKEARML